MGSINQHKITWRPHIGAGAKKRHQIITFFWFRSTGSIYGFVGRTSEKAINNLHLCSFSQGKAWWTSGLGITHFSDKPSFRKRSWISWWLAQAVMDQSVPIHGATDINGPWPPWPPTWSGRASREIAVFFEPLPGHAMLDHPREFSHRDWLSGWLFQMECLEVQFQL